MLYDLNIKIGGEGKTKLGKYIKICIFDYLPQQKMKHSRILLHLSLFVLVGKWADPGGTAMPGQPVTEPEQAPELYPLIKISLISKGGHAPRIRY